MICTFCGTDNPPTNRFCGMCGVRLERRKAERRTNPGTTAKCAGCGHVNEAGYKFCGMCGVRIDRRVQDRRGATEKSRATAAANAQLPVPEMQHSRSDYRQPEFGRATGAVSVARGPGREREHHPDSIFADEHERISSVSGPSFLGLNDPEGEGEYLLEEAGSSRRGLRTVLLLVILAAIVGLIVAQWRSSLRANPKLFEQPKSDPAAVPQGKNLPPAMKTPVAVAGARAMQSGVAQLAKNLPSLTAATTDFGSSPAKAVKLTRKSSPPPDTADDPPEKASDPPAEAKTKPTMALMKAEKYLQGRGVPQNCEQGMMYLKAATEENDPKAAVEMGALYSSGLCVQQDRVQAYKWFSSARDLDPNNRWITKNMNQLWAKMTSAERRSVR